MTPDPLRDEVHKRLTLNWLIQGASQHAGLGMPGASQGPAV